ncbi:MAG: Ycf66 family protein [Eubacterium sp.]
MYGTPTSWIIAVTSLSIFLSITAFYPHLHQQTFLFSGIRLLYDLALLLCQQSYPFQKV